MMTLQAVFLDTLNRISAKHTGSIFSHFTVRIYFHHQIRLGRLVLEKTPSLWPEWGNRACPVLLCVCVGGVGWQTASLAWTAATLAVCFSPADSTGSRELHALEPERERELLCVVCVGQRLTTLTHLLYPLLPVRSLGSQHEVYMAALQGGRESLSLTRI